MWNCLAVAYVSRKTWDCVAWSWSKDDLTPCNQATHHLVSPHDGDDEYGDEEEDDVDDDEGEDGDDEGNIL